MQTTPITFDDLRSSVIAVPPLVWAQTGEFTAGPAAAAGFALINTCAGMAGFLGAYAMGAAQSAFGSTAGVSATVAVLAVGGGLLFLLVRTSLRGPAEPPVEAAI